MLLILRDTKKSEQLKKSICILCVVLAKSLSISIKKKISRALLVAQQWRILLPVQETWVQSLVKETPWRRIWQPAPVFLPGEPHGQRRLAGYSPWGHRESDMTRQPNNNIKSEQLKAVCLLVFISAVLRILGLPWNPVPTSILIVCVLLCQDSSFLLQYLLE